LGYGRVLGILETGAVRTLIPVAAGLTPVKGTRHLPRTGLRLDTSGVVGDRLFCFVDVERARVLRTVQHPRLMTIEAGEVAADATGTGEHLTCDYWGRQVALELVESPLAAVASRLVGRPVRLARAGRAHLVYGGPGLTLVGTASLADLARHAGHLVDPARFRASLVVETATAYEEEHWAEEEVRVGTATIRIGAPVPRCAVIDHHPVTGEKDTRLLHTLVRERPSNAGGEPFFAVYADVVTAGEVSVGAGVPAGTGGH
jgi:uncharacterized protein